MTQTKPTSEVVSGIMSEELLSVEEIRSRLAIKTGLKLDKTTVLRWIHVGVGGVKLEAIRFGRNIFSSDPALARFAEARTNSFRAKGKSTEAVA